jgi:hypothetical protein
MKKDLLSLPPISRRRFAEHIAKATLGVTVLPHLGGSAAAAEAAASSRAGLWQGQGGHLAPDDRRHVAHRYAGPKEGESKGPSDPITTKAGYQLSGFMPKLAADHSEKLAIIRSMTSKTGVHASGQYLMRTAYEQRGTIQHPTIGAWAQELLGPSSKTLPSSVCVNRNPQHGNGFFSAAFSPLPIHDPEAGLQYASASADPQIMEKRFALLNKVDAGFRAKFHDTNLKAYSDFYDDTLQLLSSEDLNAFKLTDEANPKREAYGKNKFGQGCMLARRLVERGVRFVEVASGGWDMHNDIDDAMEEHGTELDTGLAALLADLARSATC